MTTREAKAKAETLTQRARSWRSFAMAGVLLAAVCAAYANSFENSFHFDDFHTITDNPAVRSLRNLPRFFTDASAFSVLPANRTYRPVVSVSLALDYWLGHGYNVLWFHLSTFVWFVGLLGMVYLLYREILDRTSPGLDEDGIHQGLKPHVAAGRNVRAEARICLEARVRDSSVGEAGPPGLKPLHESAPDGGAEAPPLQSRTSSAAWLALVGAAWFGLHPAMAETVNYVIQRGDIYCTVGCVGAMVVWAQWPERRKWGLYLLPLVFALLAKPPAAVFPVLLFFYVFFFEIEGVKGRVKKSALAVLPSLVVVGALMVLQSRMTPKSFVSSILNPWNYRMTQPFVWLRYFVELFAPVHLNVDTDLSPFTEVNARMLMGLGFLAALGVAIFVTARRKRLYPVAYGLIWFVLTQLPTSLYPLSEVENDHRMFFSFVGLILAVVWAGWLGLVALTNADTRRWLRPVLVGCVLLALTGYAWGVHVRNRVWHDEDSLWLDDVQKSPHNGRGLMIYGLTRMNIGDYPQALDYFERALLYTPNYATLEINLGVVNGEMARSDEAQRHFQRAIALAPNDDTTHAFYGRWLNKEGRTREAVAQLQTAIALNPARAMQHDVLLGIYAQSGDADALHKAAEETLADVPGDPVAESMLEHPKAGVATQGAVYWVNRSLALNQAGKFEDSIAAAQAALRLDPQLPEAWNNVAAGEEALHHWDAAIAAAQKAIALRPDFQLAKNNLAWSESQKRMGVR